MKEDRYSHSLALLERAKKVLAGGVSSEFRKFQYPHALVYSRGSGSRIYDADGNEYLDFTLSQGPLLLGHSHPHVLQSVQAYSEQGQLFAGQHIREIELAEKLRELIPSAELMRFCLSGSEAVQAAFRLARAKTGKQKFLRFEGHYHGWLDNVSWGLSSPGMEALGNASDPQAFPWSEGLPACSRDEFIIRPWNNLDTLESTLEQYHDELAAVITEPVMCNNGCILPEKGFLQGLRELCSRYGITLIFDEVITGFRLSPGGAQAYFDVEPDLSVFAKALGSGYPISVIAGKQDWMQLMESGKVIQAGTVNAANPAVAAALATLEVLEQESPYQRMFAYGRRLMQGIKAAAEEAGQPLLVQGPGPMFYTGFTERDELKDYRDTLSCDRAKLNRFISAMHEEGVRIIGRGLWYISAAHSSEDIDQAIEVVSRVLKRDF